jgi:multiple sugar transport system substrate-binding protein
MFNRAYLEENWVGFKEGHFYDEAGHFYYVPWGSMTAMLYVNKRLWDEAGLTEADYPKTWDDMVTVAKKLTKYDDTGNIEVSGFAFNGWTFPILFTDLIYEQGRYLQTKDSKGCQIDSPEGRRALETLIKFYDENINSRDFLGGGEAFETEKAAITWSWTFYTGVLHTTHPDLKFFTIKMPSFTGENLPSLGRQNYETSPVVPRYKPEERKKVAWDFLHWLHSREDNLIDLAFLHGIAPAYKKLWDHPRIVADPDMVALREVIDYKIFPGEYPNTLLAALDQNVGQNIIAGASVDEALKAGHEACNRVMQEADYWIIERLYRHDDAMIPDQP